MNLARAKILLLEKRSKYIDMAEAIDKILIEFEKERDMVVKLMADADD